MPWAQPFDELGRMVASAQLLLIGGTIEDPDAEPPVVYAAGTPLYTTKVGRAAEPTNIEAVDSQNWDPVDKVSYPTVSTLRVGTKITVEGYFLFSKTPSQVIANLYTGATVTLEFKPDRTNRLWMGRFKFDSYNDDFDTGADDEVKFTFEATCTGRLARGTDIAVPT